MTYAGGDTWTGTYTFPNTTESAATCMEHRLVDADKTGPNCNGQQNMRNDPGCPGRLCL